ncbi:lipid-A-disaccharide synthase [Litorimonas sp. RW-G-Af-16]|uniref:lipid-A-disaccharide synthase n=1 Tax=Litorimonas sp. RW-G-Af-16 TaxID=3241168 RepID=UPI00390C4C28
MTKVFILAVENSADHLGAELVTALRSQQSDLTFAGIGGRAMSAVGVPSQMDIDGLAILGFVEGLKSYPMILRKVYEAGQRIMQSGADAVVLIDSWGFMIRVAKELRKQGYTGKIIKYVAPQVWAMREGRAKILARHVDHLLTIHSFDAPYFEQYGLPVHYVGNPVFDTDYRAGDGQSLRDQYDLGERPIVSIFFGSRPSEIARLAAPFADAIELLRMEFPDLAFISPVSNSVSKIVLGKAGEDLRLQEVIFLPEDRKIDTMAASRVALACSGTMTTQLASAGVPTVVAYKLAGLTYFAAKRLFKPDYISIVNIAADALLMPEFIQDDVTGEVLAEAVATYLCDPAQEKSAARALLDQTDKMRGEGGKASDRAALAIIDILAEGLSL